MPASRDAAPPPADGRPRAARPFAIAMSRELHGLLRSFLVWAGLTAAFVVLLAALQPSMAEAGGGVFGAKLKAMPPGLLKALGITILDFRRPAGYLATSFVYLALVGALQAALFGAVVLAREEALRTAELLFVQPAGRLSLLAGKAAASLVYVVGLHALLALAAVASFAAVVDAPLEADLLLALFAGSAALALCFLGLGMLAASLVPDPRRASGAALGVVLGTFLLSALSALAPQARVLGWLSPFKLFDAARTVLDGGLDPARIAALLALGATAAAIAALRFRRKDFRA